MPRTVRHRALAALVFATVTLSVGVPCRAEVAAIDVDAMAGHTERCFGKLARVLDGAGYSHRLEYDPALHAASIVDATEALHAASGAQVTLLTDGRRMHVVAPFVSHARARALVQYAHDQSDEPWRRVCIFARAVQEDAGLRAWQRGVLAAIAAAGFGAFALGITAVARRGRAAVTPDPRPGA